MQLIGRFLWGMAAGVYTVLVPKFINETVPSNLKGPFGAMSQFMVTFGIVVPALLALNLPYFTFEEYNNKNCKVTSVNVRNKIF